MKLLFFSSLSHYIVSSYNQQFYLCKHEGLCIGFPKWVFIVEIVWTWVSLCFVSASYNSYFYVFLCKHFIMHTKKTQKLWTFYVLTICIFLLKENTDLLKYRSSAGMHLLQQIFFFKRFPVPKKMREELKIITVFLWEGRVG